MSKNGMANYGRSASYVNLSHLPTPKTEYQVQFAALTGGLNIYDPDYRLKTNESPDMENMLWKNGTLCSRSGQSFTDDDTTRGTGYTCYSGLFWGRAFFHIGSGIYSAEPGGTMALEQLVDLSELYTDYVPSRGTFLRYGENLLYKAPGALVSIHWTGSEFTVTDLASEAYTPVTYINANWRNGSGDSYQPENRLQSKKTVWFTAGTDEAQQKFSGNGSTTDFQITLADFVYVTDVTVNGETVGNWDVTGSTIHFYSAPASGTDNIVLTCQCAVKTYTLPVVPDSIVAVTVDGAARTDYTLSGATVTFSSAPPVTRPMAANTVRITYSKANPDAFHSIMDCPYAIVYGGDQNICLVVGGCPAQPNAFFWNGNHIVMDPSYWPMEHYNLGGDTEEEITGFGKQQGMLIVFKTKSVGKGNLSFTTVDVSGATTARQYIEIDYTNINSRIGCDLPWTIQLIDNNLVFCNTEQGVHILLDSSAANENNIQCVSTKVNGGLGRRGLIPHVREAKEVSSFDDTRRYWVIADGKVYCWDYDISAYKDPSWFYLTGINAVSMFSVEDTIYHLNPAGQVTIFNGVFSDYGAGYRRRYQFATQFFGGYDRLKTVTTAIFALRADTDFDIRLTYMTDYEERDDLTNLICRTYRLAPRNLKWRELHVVPFAFTARRRPGCLHVRHFAMALTCDGEGYDMPILSAQVFYKYEGRDR